MSSTLHVFPMASGYESDDIDKYTRYIDEDETQIIDEYKVRLYFSSNQTFLCYFAYIMDAWFYRKYSAATSDTVFHTFAA